MGDKYKRFTHLRYTISENTQVQFRLLLLKICVKCISYSKSYPGHSPSGTPLPQSVDESLNLVLVSKVPRGILMTIAPLIFKVLREVCQQLLLDELYYTFYKKVTLTKVSYCSSVVNNHYQSQEMVTC